MQNNQIPTRTFGKAGKEVTIVGLGGEGVLRTRDRTVEAGAVINEALRQGIRYFDSARAYAGSQSYYGSVWGKAPRLRAGVFQASKSAARKRQAALADLEESLAVMGIEQLDLWQIHDLRTRKELETISGPGGALEAFVQAKAAGKTRFIGVTGHHDPEVLSEAVRQWPLDAVMMPVNPAEAVLGGFLDQTLPLARAKGLAVIGMKVLGASQFVFPEEGFTAERLLRYALSQDITVAIVGCSSPEEVRTLAGVGRDFVPLSAAEQSALVESFRPHARRLAFYRGPF